jgi:hypothetical protein
MNGTWLPLKPIRKQSGHLFVNLVRGGIKKCRAVHRLVLEAFVGPCPPGYQCCHWDGDPGNNHLENLRWGTPKDNADDTLRHGRRAVGARVRAKLTESQVLEIRRLSAGGCSARELAARFSVSSQNIALIVSRRTWKYLGAEVDQRSEPTQPHDEVHRTGEETGKTRNRSDGSVASLVVVATVRQGNTETRLEIYLSDPVRAGTDVASAG